MADELEALALASAGGLAASNRSGDAELCSNCGAVLSEAFCHVCGQRAADLRRPIWALIGEGLSDSFALDGRIAQTLPTLFWRPGRVTRAYLDGKRARFVPPFRMFLLSSLVFFATLFAVGDRLGWTDGVRVQPQASGGFRFVLGDEVQDSDERPVFIRPDNTLDEDALRAEMFTLAGDDITVGERAELNLAVDQMAGIYNNQDAFLRAVEVWLPRLSLLLFPFFTLALALLFAWRRSVYIYDHLITTLHFQSWFYLACAATIIAAYVVSPWAWAGLAVALPVYVLLALRRVYWTSWVAGALRTIVLLVAALVAFGLLMFGVILIGAVEVAGPVMLRSG